MGRATTHDTYGLEILILEDGNTMSRSNDDFLPLGGSFALSTPRLHEGIFSLLFLSISDALLLS